MWDTTSFAARGTFRGFLLGVHCVAISPDGQRLAVGSVGKEAFKTWDLESGEELLTLESPEIGFAHCGFSPDGDALLGTAWDGVVHIWTAPSWGEIAAAEAREKAEASPR
jgi:WD40 repeat protein